MKPEPKGYCDLPKDFLKSIDKMLDDFIKSCEDSKESKKDSTLIKDLTEIFPE